MVDRSIVVALGTVIIILVAGFVVAFTQISNLNSQITNLQNKVASQNAAINSLNSAIDSLNGTITSLQENVTELQSTANNVQLKNSSNYFSISNLGALCYTVGNNSAYNQTYYGSIVLICEDAFNFTPINGTATDVRIFVTGEVSSPVGDWMGIAIPNGTSTFSGELMSNPPIPSYRQSDGTYTMQVRITCDEADGYITLNFMAGVNLVSLGPVVT